MTMSYIFLCQYLTWQTITELTLTTCPAFLQRGTCPITPMFSPRACSLSCKSMLKNVPAYLHSRKELYSSVFQEIHENRFFLKRIYAANIIWCALLPGVPKKILHVFKSLFFDVL